MPRTGFVNPLARRFPPGADSRFAIRSSRMPLLQPCLSFGDLFESILWFLGGPDHVEVFGDELGVLPGDGPVIPIGVFRGWPVFACEAVPGQPFPDYAERRRWRERLPDPCRRGLLVFTDAAHSAFVWTWRAVHPTGHRRYVEYKSATRSRQLRAALAGLPDFGSDPETTTEADPLVVDRLFEMVVRAGEPGSRGERERLQLILDRIERIEDPDESRRVWRRLRGFSVLHDDCVDGGRLVAAGATLELVMAATLERMRSFVEDGATRRDRRRPEHLRDLRALTEGAEGPTWFHDQARYLRRRIVQQNLFATVTCRTAGRVVLRDLLRFAGTTPDAGIPMIDCNIWRWKSTDGRRRPAVTRRQSVGAGSASGPGDEDELALLHTAWGMVREIRLAGGEFPELKRAACQLQRRRQLLLRQLQALDRAEESEWPPGVLGFCRLTPDRGFSAVVNDTRPE